MRQVTQLLNCNHKDVAQYPSCKTENYCLWYIPQIHLINVKYQVNIAGYLLYFAANLTQQTHRKTVCLYQKSFGNVTEFFLVQAKMIAHKNS